ncbi:probable rRNA-processing protein EBP2 [Ornithodoros turicata]|uniref:probable rRNA-processing protein EBP2 n=1 Tax=Ornithodoros turicata TaxID=34597 RepID=UPI00313A3D5A
MSDSDSESYDEDAQLQDALEKGELQPGLYAVAPHVRKEHINNTVALTQKLAEIQLDLDWIETLDMVNGLAPLTPELRAQYGELQLQPKQKGNTADYMDGDPVHHDFLREMTFYRQAQTAVREGIPKLKQLGVTTKRPEDYFAEMAKSDDHMKKVREKLLSKKNAMERSERVKQLREMKKFGKKVQTEVLQKRQKEKKEMMDNLKKLKKGQGNLDFLDTRSPRPGGLQGQQGKPVKKKLTKKQKMKDKRYGYGGQKKRSKYNTASSSADVSGYSKRKYNMTSKQKLKVKSRPGKQRRQQMKSRQNRR